MAAIGQTWRFPKTADVDLYGPTAGRHLELIEEGHASVRGSGRDPETGDEFLLITVIPGRPKGWSDLYGDDDDDLSADERAHFGLDLPPYSPD